MCTVSVWGRGGADCGLSLSTEQAQAVKAGILCHGPIVSSVFIYDYPG